MHTACTPYLLLPGLGILHQPSTSAEPVLAVAESIDRPIRQRHTVIAVSAGSFHSLLVTSVGTAYSFGSGDNGRLGHGDTSNKFTPSLIAGESSRSPLPLLLPALLRVGYMGAVSALLRAAPRRCVRCVWWLPNAPTL